MGHPTAGTSTPTTGAAVPTIPLASLAPWLLFAAVLAATVIFFVTTEQGALSVTSGTLVHEFVHDGRHLLGYPCH